MNEKIKTRLSAFLPYRLSVLSNTISKNIATIYSTEFGLSIWQWRIMAVVGESPGLTATQVTNQTAMDKPAVSRAVASLIEQKLLKREASQEDGRTSLLYLTRAGQDIYDRIFPRALTHETELTSGLTRAELDTFNALLDKLADKSSPKKKLW